MKIQNKYLLILVASLLLLSIFLLYTIEKQKNSKKEIENLYNSLNSELVVWKDKDGMQRAKIQILETENILTFLKLKSKDSTILSLQNTVKKYKKQLKDNGSVTVITTDTDIDISIPTDVEVPNDTSDFPVYKSKFDLNGWVYGNILAGKDSTSLRLKVRNDYSVIIGYENQGLFKPKKPFVEVVNRNPYTEVQMLRTYKVSGLKQKRWGIGPSFSYGLNSELKSEFVAGVSIQYSIFRF